MNLEFSLRGTVRIMHDACSGDGYHVDRGSPGMIPVSSFGTRKESHNRSSLPRFCTKHKEYMWTNMQFERMELRQDCRSTKPRPADGVSGLQRVKRALRVWCVP